MTFGDLLKEIIKFCKTYSFDLKLIINTVPRNEKSISFKLDLLFFRIVFKVFAVMVLIADIVSEFQLKNIK